MLHRWRWDQGRLTYFQFDNLRQIANCLVHLEGVTINQKEIDPLRQELENTTHLPFAPKDYRVWRNYKRVFECSFLATKIDDRLYTTDFCKKIADDGNKTIDVDEFLSLFIPRFRFPFPAFADYHKSANPVYPFCAVLKYLTNNFLLGREISISLEEVFSILVGNGCTGLEPLEYYSKLRETKYEPEADEYRQVREMLIFISQLSILKWYGGRLYLDTTLKDYEEYGEFKMITTPIFQQPKETREEEYLTMTALDNEIAYPFKLLSRETPTDDLFLEGKRTRVTHLKIERSPLLRRLFFEKYPDPVCNMCVCNIRDRYPWTENMLEVHHILPLSSALLITGEGTSITDVVGLCPNCHKSVHTYYKGWLNKNKVEDFQSKDEAREIYFQAKSSIRL